MDNKHKTETVEDVKCKNTFEPAYLKAVDDIIHTGTLKSNRTNVKTYSKFTKFISYDLNDGFPICTTKKMNPVHALIETLWILRGQTNTKILDDQGVKYWNANSTREFLDARGLHHYPVGDLGPCFTKNTPVLTDNGYKPIQEVSKTDKLFTHLGNFKPINEVMQRQYTGEIIKLGIKYIPKIITVTPEHPFYVQKFSIAKIRGLPNQVILEGDPQFIEASNLNKACHLVGMKIETSEIIPSFTLEKYVNQHVAKKVYTKVLYDPNFWWMMGYYTGNGWCQENSRISFAIPDKYANIIVPKLRTVLDIAIKKCDRDQACETYRVHNQEAAFILKEFKKYAYGKVIPNWVHCAPKNLISVYLDGYRMADGCERNIKGKTQYRYTTVSMDLALSVQRLYLKIGKFATVSFHECREPNQCIEGRTVNKRDSWTIGLYADDDIRRSNYSFIKDNYAWFAISTLETLNVTDETVYNFSVDQDNTYTVANVNVHNCYGFQLRHFGAKYYGYERIRYGWLNFFRILTSLFLGMLCWYGLNNNVIPLDSNFWNDMLSESCQVQHIKTITNILGIIFYVIFLLKYIFDTSTFESPSRFTKLLYKLGLPAMISYEGKGVDQLANIIKTLKTNPEDRRMVAIAWNPMDIHKMALPPCFPAGTLVLTNNGYKKIELVDKNDMLMTHTGKFRSINDIHVTNTTTSIFSIKVENHPHKIKSTPEHPFYTVTKQDMNPKWIKMEDLTNDHFVGIKIDESFEIPSFTYCAANKQIGTRYEIKEQSEWFMLGYFLGNGWVLHKNGKNKYRIYFAIPNTKKEAICDQLKQVLALHEKNNVRTSGCTKFECRNLKWWTILRDFGHLAHGKKIPEWVHKAPPNMIQWFLNGYIEADGCDTNGRHYFTTVSDDLAFSLQRLYLKLGRFVTIFYQKRPPTCIIEGRTVNQRNTYDISVAHSNKSTKSRFIENGYAWFGISEIQKEEAKFQTVYNFDVEEDHTYIVENVTVHNCHSIAIIFMVLNKHVNVHQTQRSADFGLGVPFNFMQHAIITIMAAHLSGLEPGQVAHSFVDAHVYENHKAPLETQINRIPKNLPTFKIKAGIKRTRWEDFQVDDFELEGYEHDKFIKMEMAV